MENVRLLELLELDFGGLNLGNVVRYYIEDNFSKAEMYCLQGKAR